MRFLIDRLLLCEMSELLRVAVSRLASFEAWAELASGADACWRRVSRCLPALDAHPLSLTDDYAHKTAAVELPGLTIAIGMGSPFSFRVNDHAHSSFLISCGGRSLVRQGGVLLGNSPDVPGLYLPGEAFCCEIRNAHGYLISVRPERLAASALTLAEARGLDSVDLAALQRPVALDLSQAHSAHVLAMLQTTLQLLEQGPAPAASAPPVSPLHRASIGDLICRQLCVLLIPELLEPVP